MRTIYFDMDGTIADLYGVDGWLNYLLIGDTFPYEEAKPLVRLCTLARKLNQLQRDGYAIGVISWLSKNGSSLYNEMVTEAKLNWLNKHLPSVHWDEIHIVPYGTPKEIFCKSSFDILFDDGLHNRENWTGRAFDVEDILDCLKNI